jgi:hypothetical protein
VSLVGLNKGGENMSQKKRLRKDKGKLVYGELVEGHLVFFNEDDIGPSDTQRFVVPYKIVDKYGSYLRFEGSKAGKFLKLLEVTLKIGQFCPLFCLHSENVSLNGLEKLGEIIG